MYEYEALVVRVIDADSIVVDLDYGFDEWKHNLHVRLSGIDAPERWTEAGETARTYVMELLPAGSKVVIQSEQYNRSDKYGRCLATILLEDGQSLKEMLFAKGHGVPYFGGKR